MRSTASLCLVLAVSIPGCAAEHTPSEWTVVDSAGIRIVSSPPNSIWTDETKWTLERELSIGVADGAREYQFGRVIDVDAGPDDRIYVLDEQAAEVRVFDAAGGYLFSFGGAGEGPGELSRQPPGPRAVLITPDGEIFVPDQGNARVNRFSLGGEFHGSFPLQMEVGLPVAWSSTPDGEYISHHSSTTWAGLLRFAADGEVLDTIVEFDLRPPRIHAEGPRQALEHADLWTVLADGRIIHGSSDRFRIAVRGLDGTLQMVLRREPEAIPLSRHEQHSYLKRLGEIWSEMFRARGEPEAWIESQVRDIPQVYTPPTHAPVFAGFVGGPDGTIWVRRPLPLDSITSTVLDGFRRPLEEFWSPTWEVFSEEGRSLGDVAMPRRFTLYRIKGSRIYGVERDALGINRVVRLRVVMR